MKDPFQWLWHKIKDHPRAQARFREPVVVLESDNWGLRVRNVSDILAPYGTPGVYACEESETREDLEALYHVLERFRSRDDRPACVTGNFIVANPDFKAIAKDGFRRYYDVPVSHDADLGPAWLEGMRRKALFPQYHGRSHICADLWLRDLRQGEPCASLLFSRGLSGGKDLLSGHANDYFSEYIDWETGKERSREDEVRWIRTGVDYFKEAFGYFPESTIAPYYVFSSSTLQAWKEAGFRYVQGCHCQITRASDGKCLVQRRRLGEKMERSLIALGRNARLELRFLSPTDTLARELQKIVSLLRNRVPVVIDTHRINYTGKFRTDGLAMLKEALEVMACFKPLFLTSVEFGEAVRSGGFYHDVWSGQVKRLTMLQPWQAG